MGGATHLHRQNAALVSSQICFEFLKFAFGERSPDRIGLVGFNQVLKGQNLTRIQRTSGSLEEFPVGLNDLKILIKKEKELRNTRQDPFSKRSAGLHLLVLFQYPNNEILPLLLKYFYGLVVQTLSSRSTDAPGQYSQRVGPVTKFIHCETVSST